MARQFAELQNICNQEAITQEKNIEFLYLLQSAVLLALREHEVMNMMQYRHAEEALKQQRQKRAIKLLSNED